MAALREFIKRLFRIAPAPEGRPFILGNTIVGRWTESGGLILLPGFSIETIGRLGDQELYDACRAHGEADDREGVAGNLRTSRVAANLESMPDLRLKRVIDPLADADQQQAEAEENSGRVLRRSGSDHAGRSAGRQHLPPVLKVKALQVHGLDYSIPGEVVAGALAACLAVPLFIFLLQVLPG